MMNQVTKKSKRIVLKRKLLKRKNQLKKPKWKMMNIKMLQKNTLIIGLEPMKKN